MQAFKRRIFLSLLCEQKQFVQPETTSEFRRIWIHRQRAIPVNWNFAAVWQGDVGTHFDLYFAHWDARPSQERLQSEGRDNFAAIIQKQRHARGGFVG